jgi:hypothetical protein
MGRAAHQGADSTILRSTPAIRPDSRCARASSDTRSSHLTPVVPTLFDHRVRVKLLPRIFIF